MRSALVSGGLLAAAFAAACGARDLAAVSTEADVVSGPRVLDCPGPRVVAHVNHGHFWEPEVALGPFWYEAWVMPRAAGSTYWLSDGCGGKHTILMGFRQDTPGAINYPSGNLWSDGGGVQILANDGLAPGEWGHVAIGWDGRTVRTWLDGVLVGAAPHAGRRLSPRTLVDCGGYFFVCGSDHNNFDGRIARLRGFEGLVPLDLPEHAFRPERVFQRTVVVGGTERAASFLAEYTWPSLIVADLSPAGYLGRLHPGQLHGADAAAGNDFGFGQASSGLSTYPMPVWVSDARAPSEGGLSHAGSTPPPAPGPPPPGALLFDSFSRASSTPAFDDAPSLGDTEGGARGRQAWRTACVATGGGGAGGCAWGILGGRAVYLGDGPSVAWVDAGRADVDASVTRRIGVGDNGLTGLAVRVRGPGDLTFAYAFADPAGAVRVRAGRLAGGAPRDVVDLTPAGAGWTRLRIVARGADVGIFVDDTRLGALAPAGAVDPTATGAGLFLDSPLGPAAVSSLARFDDFTVLPAK